MFFMYVKNLINNQFVVAYLQRKIHIVNNLKIKLLLNINVINSKKILVDMNQQKLIIKNCQKFIVKLKITIKDNVKIRRVIWTKKKFVIQTNSMICVSMKIREKSLFDKNYFFESYLTNVYVYVVDLILFFVCVINKHTSFLRIARYVKMKNFVEFEKQNCY